MFSNVHWGSLSVFKSVFPNSDRSQSSPESVSHLWNGIFVNAQRRHSAEHQPLGSWDLHPCLLFAGVPPRNICSKDNKQHILLNTFKHKQQSTIILLNNFLFVCKKQAFVLSGPWEYPPAFPSSLALPQPVLPIHGILSPVVPQLYPARPLAPGVSQGWCPIQSWPSPSPQSLSCLLLSGLVLPAHPWGALQPQSLSRHATAPQHLHLLPHPCIQNKVSLENMINATKNHIVQPKSNQKSQAVVACEHLNLNLI